MTICPIAIAVGCQKCPVFKICPLKGVIGDQPKASDVMPEVKAPAKRATKPRAAAAKKKSNR